MYFPSSFVSSSCLFGLDIFYFVKTKKLGGGRIPSGLAGLSFLKRTRYKHLDICKDVLLEVTFIGI